MIHNTTEGLAIVSPLAKTKVRRMIGKIIIMGLAGVSQQLLAPGSEDLSILPFARIFLSIGAGAIFQVVF